MHVIAGDGLYGKVDHVPGLFYVVTRFVHVNGFPLVPVASMLMLDEAKEGGSARGCQIKLNAKSLAFAWLRAVMILSGIVLVFQGLIGIIGFNDSAGALRKTAWAVGAWLLCAMSYRLSRPRVTRALQLAARAKIPPEVVARAFAANGYRRSVVEDYTLESRAADG